MIYTIEKANLIAEQLRKFTSGYTHHVVGHFSNIDFWMKEVKGALDVIDDHKNRFDKIFSAQNEWNEEHGTVVHDYCSVCKGKCEFSDGIPRLPKLKCKSEKSEARKTLVDSTYYFLARCYRIGLLSIDEWSEKCESIGTSIDMNDIGK